MVRGLRLSKRGNLLTFSHTKNLKSQIKKIIGKLKYGMDTGTACTELAWG